MMIAHEAMKHGSVLHGSCEVSLGPRGMGGRTILDRRKKTILSDPRAFCTFVEAPSLSIWVAGQ